MKSVMKHNAEDGELVCYAPSGEEVLRIIELDFKKAIDIGNAVQAAYRKGRILGRLEMQRSIERHMDDLNA